MCNLYRIASGPAEIGRMTLSLFGDAGNLEPRDIIQTMPPRSSG